MEAHLMDPQMLDVGEPYDPEAEFVGKIFVGGLSWQTTRETLRFHFQKFDEIVDAEILLDRQSGQVWISHL